MKERAWLPVLSLFTSMSTLFCCALPALFVVLGMGGAFAGLLSHVPQLIWLSEHKASLFLLAGGMLILGGFAQYKAKNLPCPIDPIEADACAKTRKWSKITYLISVAIYLVGFAFAYGIEFLQQ
jgi:hypothetical protein